MQLRLWHLRHAAWITALLPWGVAGPKRPIYWPYAFARFVFRAGIIHWHIRQAAALGQPEPPLTH